MIRWAPIAILIAMVIVRIASMLILVKYLSLTFGPERFGALSQIMGIAAVFYMFAGGGFSNGLIKSVAEDASTAARAAWMGAAVFICVATSIVLLAIAVVLYFVGASTLLLDAGLAPVFLVIGVGQLIVGAGNVALAYLSGAGNLRGFAMSNVIGSILGLVFLLALAVVAGFAGATFGAALLPLGPGLVAILLLLRGNAGTAVAWPADKDKIVELLKFSGVSIVAVSAVPLTLLYIRADLAESAGWRAVGYWQAIARASDAYMQIFGVLFMNFFLPQLSTHRGSEKLDVMKRYGLVFPALFAAGAVAFYLLREPVIRVAFSVEFLPAVSFVAPQLVGDLAKVGTWIFVYYFISISRIWVQGFAEAAQATIMILAYLMLLSTLGQRAAVVGHMIACLLVLFATSALFLFRRKLITGKP
jgi:O-antigen/teichoic acid export membrane protein